METKLISDIYWLYENLKLYMCTWGYLYVHNNLINIID